MTRLLQLLRKYTTPEGLSPGDGIAYWQEKVLLNLLLVLVILGLITYIPSVALAFKENLWLVIAADTLMYAAVLILFLKKDISYRIRAVSIPLLTHLLGVVLIATLGPIGAGPVWLFFFPVITGILLGRSLSFVALAVNLITIIIMGAIIHFDLTRSLMPMNFKVWQLSPDYTLELWVVIGLNFMLLNTITTLAITTILDGLQNSMHELKISEKKYRRIFENIMDVYFETRLDGSIVEVSPSIEKISSYTKEEFTAASLIDIYHDLDQREETISLLLEKGEVTDHEIKFLDKDGRVLICSVNARLTPENGSKPTKVIGILRDMTAQKTVEQEKQALEERLNRSHKMEAIGLLAGGVAHDLNNILSGIVTYPELLLMDLAQNDPLRKPLELIQSSGNKAVEIVQDLLTLSRRGVINREVLNLNNLVSGFLHTPEYQKILSFHPGIRVEKHIQADIPFLKGSSVHLQKTLMNLISNAAEAQPGGGQIIIETRNIHLDAPVKGYDQVETGDYIILGVEDKGTGISPEDLTRIFEPFFTKKIMGRSGTGLGMAVVWGTVQDHEGYIDIISEEGRGTIFNLYFPLSEEGAVIPSESFRMEAFMGSNETILIVDDIAEQRQIAGVALKKLGYQTVAVESGEKAVEYLKDNNVHLVLLDMIMEQGMDGCETYRRMLEVRPGQKAVIASGYSRTRQVKDTLKMGAGSYLKKPYTIEKLGKAVKKELARTG